MKNYLSELLIDLLKFITLIAVFITPALVLVVFNALVPLIGWITTITIFVVLITLITKQS